MPTEKYLTEDFKCFLTITSRNRKNYGKSCCNWVYRQVRKYLDLDELTLAILNDIVKVAYVHAQDELKGYREQ